MKVYWKIAGGVVALLAVAAFIVWYRVASMGQEALRDIATQAGLCETADCAEGMDEASSYLAEEFGLSPRLVKWCVGVDTLSERMGSKGLVNSSWWIDLLYKPCGEPILE